MRAIVRSWWPLPAAVAAGTAAGIAFRSRFGELGDHAAGHLESASGFLPSLTVIAVILWATPRARRQPDVWLAAGAWAAAVYVIMIGNLRVVDVIRAEGWTDEQTELLGDGVPAYLSGHDLAALGGWAAVGAAIALAIVLLIRGHVSPRAAVGSIALSVVVPSYISPGAGVLVLVVALCLARRRHQTTAVGADTIMTKQPSHPSPS